VIVDRISCSSPYPPESHVHSTETVPGQRSRGRGRIDAPAYPPTPGAGRLPPASDRHFSHLVLRKKGPEPAWVGGNEIRWWRIQGRSGLLQNYQAANLRTPSLVSRSDGQLSSGGGNRPRRPTTDDATSAMSSAEWVKVALNTR